MKLITNKLPEGFDSWYCLYLYLEKRGKISLDNKPNIEPVDYIPKPYNSLEDEFIELDKYELDFDYIKARAFEEIAKYYQFDFNELAMILEAVCKTYLNLGENGVDKKLHEMMTLRRKLDYNLTRMPV